VTGVRRVERNDLRVPARVLDLELTGGSSGLGAVVDVGRYNSVWCLSRVNGVPQEISFWDVGGDDALVIQALRDQLRGDQLRGEFAPNSLAAAQAPPPMATEAADLTVVICTRDRPDGLRAALNSLRRQTDSAFDVVVVDNNPGTRDSAKVVDEVGLPRCEYVVEPRPGLSRARNRGLQSVRTELVAWMDDDETADPNWARAVKQGFAHESRPAALCGVMLPAELEYDAQVRFEQYGGFNKGRGMAPEVLRAGTPSVTSPLYPLPAFGAGGNMAFRTQPLLGMGGFDPCLGAGTRTHGCEETRALSLVLSAGDAVLHWPAAIMWHTHRRDMAGLREQFYGYSAGASAFYVSMIKSRPSALFDILRLFPHALRDFRGGSGNQRSGHLPDDFPAELRKASRRGLLEGPFMYVCEVIKDRRKSVSAEKKNSPGSEEVLGSATHA
jgi:glycosyltransferase involved in cell wall biosynthesis